MLKNKEFKSIINEIIEFGINRYRKEYANNYSDTSFVLYKKYTYDDVCRLLNWDNSIVPLNIGGYKFDKKTKTFPIFINYIKSDDINDSIRYEDRFTNQSTLIALSKAKRTLESEDVKTFLNADKLGVQNHLFIRKNKDDKMSKDEIFELFKDFKYIVPGGSVMSGLGSEKLVSFSNCFIAGTKVLTTPVVLTQTFRILGSLTKLPIGVIKIG